MAFFKFRWPGQKAAEGKPAKVSKAVRGETVEVLRRRARHRLIGAALLVMVAVVGFPVLFDTQPRPIPVDTRIEIPDRDKVAPLVVPAPVVAAAPAAPASEVKEPAAKPPREPAPAKPATPAPERAAAPPTVAAPARSETTEAFVVARPKPEASAAAPVPAPVPAPANRQPTEAERARALLEGRVAVANANPPPVPVAAPGAERFIVQVGAFSDDAKVREARSKLERAGLPTYTQVVDTKDGKRTRVRVGPFQGRADADKASAKIRGLGLPASVLSL